MVACRVCALRLVAVHSTFGRAELNDLHALFHLASGDHLAALDFRILRIYVSLTAQMLCEMLGTVCPVSPSMACLPAQDYVRPPGFLISLRQNITGNATLRIRTVKSAIR